MDFLIFPAKTAAAKKKKQKSRSKKRNTSARSKAEETISPVEECKSDDGEDDQDGVTEKYEISPEPEVSEPTGVDEDGGAEAEFVSVVRTKKKTKQRPISDITIRSERDSGARMLGRKDKCPSNQPAPVTEGVSGYNAKPAPWAGYMPDRAGEGIGEAAELSLNSNVPENERDHSEPRKGEKGSLRPIVIDGSNVAYCHGRDRDFSAKGIHIVVEDFLSRGHEKIVVFLPKQRGRSHHDRELLEKLENKCTLSFAPSRQRPSGEIISTHDDYYILNYAAKHGAVVVTLDNFRDHAYQKPEWDVVIRDRILMPTFVGDDIQWPEDPLGRNGPRLDDFLRF